MVAMTDFSFSTEQMSILSKFLALTQIIRLLLIPVRTGTKTNVKEFPFLAAALDFHVFVVQTTRLKQSNTKELERIKSLFLDTKLRNQRNVELACSANEERVFSPLDQSRVSNFVFRKRKIK